MPTKKKTVTKKATRKKVVKKKRVSGSLEFGTGYDFEKDGVTQSILSSFLACRQRAQFILDGWQKPRNKAALIFGSFFHWLIEEHIVSITNEGVGLANSFGALESEWRNKMVTEGEVDRDALELYIAMAHALFEEYCNFWQKKDESYEWIGVESQFEKCTDRYQHTFKMRGMRDGIFRRKGKLWILETKTAGRIDEETLNQTLNFDFQSLFYVTASELEFREPVAGILYNVVRKPQLRQKKEEPFRDYAERMKIDVAERPEFYFKRFEVPYTKKRKRLFREELMMKFHEMDLWRKGELPTYKNQTACVGKWGCEFIQACASGTMAGYTQTRELFGELSREQ